MNIIIDNTNYDVEIEYKYQKNMYLRVKDDLKIHISAPMNMSMSNIKRFISTNKDKIDKILIHEQEKKEKLENKILYLGKNYDINYIKNNKIIFTNDKVFIKKDYNLDNFYRNKAKEVFQEQLDICYNLFEESIPYPSLKIRKMTSKWGVCNIKTKTITLNLELIKYDIKYLDYVIIHELSHLIYPNHSKDFWNLVSKYEPNYKLYRKEMKEFS